MLGNAWIYSWPTKAWSRVANIPSVNHAMAYLGYNDVRGNRKILMAGE